MTTVFEKYRKRGKWRGEKAFINLVQHEKEKREERNNLRASMPFLRRGKRGKKEGEEEGWFYIYEQENKKGREKSLANNIIYGGGSLYIQR